MPILETKTIALNKLLIDEIGEHYPTYYAFCKVVGMWPSEFSKLLRGWRDMRYEEKKRFAIALNTTVDQMLHRNRRS